MAKKLATDEDPKGFAMRHSALKEDYQELQRENRSLKKRIQRAKVKRDSLLGVVRFLRRRSRILKGLGFEEPANKAMVHEGGMDASISRQKVWTDNQGNTYQQVACIISNHKAGTNSNT